MQLSEEELKQRKREYNKRYRESEKGKNSQKKANDKYQKTEAYKKYKHEYYLKKNIK
jgi:hypothetical protein